MVIAFFVGGFSITSLMFCVTLKNMIQTNTFFGHISKICLFDSNKLCFQWHTTYFPYNDKITKSGTITIVLSYCKVLLPLQCKVAYFMGSSHKLFFTVRSISYNKQTGEQTSPYRQNIFLILKEIRDIQIR